MTTHTYTHIMNECFKNINDLYIYIHNDLYMIYHLYIYIMLIDNYIE